MNTPPSPSPSMTMSESSRREALSVPDLFGNVLLADSGGSVRVSASHVHSFGDGGEGFSIPENSELEERDGPEQLRTAAPPHSWSKVATHSTASLALQDLMKMKPQHVLPQTAADVEGMLGLASDDLLDPVIREKLGRLLLLWLIKGLHKSGSSTHRTETLSRNAAFALEINMTIAAFPNLLMLHFTPPPSLPEVRSESLHVTMTQGLDCAALQDYADLSAQIAFRQLDLVEGLMRIRQISERPPLFGNEISLISFAAMAGLAPLAFYGGGIFDAIFSTLLGTVIGLFLIYLSGIGRIANITPFLAAAFASFSSTAVASAMPPGYTFCPLSCTLSALLWLLPGLGLTTGIAELAVKSIISGSSRFFSAMICAVQLGYGIVIGSEIVAWYDQADASLQRALHEGCSLAPSPFLLPLFLVLISLTFNILLNCPLSIWVFTSGAALLGGGLFALLGGGGYAVMDDQLALAVSSFAVGVCGQLVALIRGHQSLVTIICGILVLVPGGYASRTAASLLTQPSLDVAMFLLTTVLTAFSLTIGLLAAKALIPSTPHRLRAPIYKSHQIPPNASLLELI